MPRPSKQLRNGDEIDDMLAPLRGDLFLGGFFGKLTMASSGWTFEPNRLKHPFHGLANLNRSNAACRLRRRQNEFTCECIYALIYTYIDALNII